MRIYLKSTVYEAALNRIRWVFDEFGTVIVSFSGGKDSTVILNLALQVAREKNRLPLKVFFIDQEGEWESVIAYIRWVMSLPEVEPLWLQCPIRISNTSSPEVPWLYCWEEDQEWLRPKEAISLKENVYGTLTFKEIYKNFLEVHYPDQPVAYLIGVRGEENPMRSLVYTRAATYKWITWSKRLSPIHHDFAPLYDWTWRDVWKAIHANGWRYTSLYDVMYQYGIPVRDMRVSNVHHETARRSLFFMQEVEPELWDKITQRLQGVRTAGQLGYDNFAYDGTLPSMFDSYWEYREYLWKHLILPEFQPAFRKIFSQQERDFYKGIYYERVTFDVLMRVHIAALLLNDYHSVTMANFHGTNTVGAHRRRWTAVKEQYNGALEKPAG